MNNLVLCQKSNLSPPPTLSFCIVTSFILVNLTVPYLALLNLDGSQSVLKSMVLKIKYFRNIIAWK